MSKQTIVQMWYDSYEADFGDGFYPQVEQDSGMVPIKVSFEYSELDNTWTQNYGMNIKGLDGNCGDLLIVLLNKQGGTSSNRIRSKNKNVLFSKD